MYSTYKVVGFDRVSDGKNKLYVVYLNKEMKIQNSVLFKKSSIVVDTLPDNVYGKEVKVFWKENRIEKVEK